MLHKFDKIYKIHVYCVGDSYMQSMVGSSMENIQTKCWPMLLGDRTIYGLQKDV